MIIDKTNQGVGLTVSVPMFFKQDQTLDFDTLSRYLDDVCKNKKIYAVYSMAYNSRYRMLEDYEVLEVNKFVIKKVKSWGHKAFIGHPYIFTKKSLYNYLECIASESPDGISMLYPERYFYINNQLTDFLRMPSEVGLKPVLHEMNLVSGLTGELINWPSELLKSVFDSVEFVAIKEDSKNDRVTEEVLALCNKFDVTCILAGGGKIRALEYVDKGLKTWLNGSTIFLPHLIDRIYTAIMARDERYCEWYISKVETPFFQRIVSKYGWHLAHKAALQYFGYGHRSERFPHAVMSDAQYDRVTDTLAMIEKSVASIS